MEGRYLEVASAATGLIAHQFFKRLEPSVVGFLTSMFVFFLSFLFLTNNFDLLSPPHTIHSVIPAMKALAICLATLSTSIIVYRLFLNPLCAFPGDATAALSKWKSYLIARNGKTHFYLHNQHQKYGDYVRVGPNEISVSNVDDLPIIHGAKSKFNKGPWYFKNLNEPEPALFSLTDFDEHKKRRKVWDVALSSRAMLAYEPRIQRCMDSIVAQFDRLAKTGEVFDFRKWVELMAFDIMGLVSFDVDFHMVETGRKHMYVEFVHGTLNYVASLANISWIMPVVFVMPIPEAVRKATSDFMKFGKEAFQARMKKGAVEQDIFGFLLREGEQDSAAKISETLLEAETRSTIVGGSDTTAVAMNSIFYWLLVNPAAYKKLKKELLGLFQTEQFSGAKLGDTNKAPYLNACVNEALRLLPPGPNGMQRVMNTPGGITLDGKFVPEGTKISVHGWTVQHDERNFEKPWEFIPERWLPDSGFKGAHNPAAFIPFSLGSYQCVGRKLALLEIRMFVYTVLTNFDLELDKGFDTEHFISQTESYLTLTKSPLPVKLIKA